MLGHVQAQDAPEDSQAEQPEVERDARHEAKHGRHSHLKDGSFHDDSLWASHVNAGKSEDSLKQRLCSRLASTQRSCRRAALSAPPRAGHCPGRPRPMSATTGESDGSRFRIGRNGQRAGTIRRHEGNPSSPGSRNGSGRESVRPNGSDCKPALPVDAGYSSRDRRHIMTNATITRPEWSTVIDPVLQKELEQHVLVTNWDKLLGIVDTVYNWGRRSALWPLGFGLACCAIEMICTASSRFDIARFGAEVFRGSPRQADLMIVSGTVTKTMMPMIARLYDQMPEPKYVIAMGACATGGGPFKEGYNVVSGVDKYIPVDVYIPGCPPTPQALLNGLIMLQKKIDGERLEIPLLGKTRLLALVRQRGRARYPDPGARART